MVIVWLQGMKACLYYTSDVDYITCSEALLVTMYRLEGPVIGARDQMFRPVKDRGHRLWIVLDVVERSG